MRLLPQRGRLGPVRLAISTLSTMLALGLLAGSALACEPREGADDGQAQPTACADQAFAEFQTDSLPHLTLEVARTEPERERGLMFRDSMPDDRGMVFIFEQPSQVGFWMRNTLIPLSIAWLDANGTIVDIQDMQPLTDTPHVPSGPYVYAIEVNQGWFRANGVAPGQQARLCLGDGSGR